MQITKAAVFSLAVTLITSTLLGCGMNFSQELPTGGAPTNDSSVVIYGLRTASKHSKFALTLDAYDPSTGTPNGNCFRWDRMRANIPSGSTQTKYFAFRVAPGHYVYGPTQRPLIGPLLSFDAAPGKTVLIGEFFLTASNEVELIRNLTKSKPEVLSALPNASNDMELANANAVDGVRLFLCTP